ncbi:type III secretion system protein SctP [Burkholderia ubonensis]|uniref:type III secretion system protein SctP n=1 Tax=Burkholderia ubonensis TaxID=101571 RepID=UPI0009B3544D|nr:type III secretion system protein SctP [Burkholderia ubonensis]
MTTPSASNPHSTAETARRLLVSPSWRGPAARPSHGDAAPARVGAPMTEAADSSGALPAWTNRSTPDGAGAPRNVCGNASTEAFPDGARARQSDARTVHTLLPDRHRFGVSIAPFVHQITQFCSHDAIRLAGNWNARLVLDESILAGTTLNVSLSRFDLSLVFETRDPATRYVLVAHVDELEQLLRASLHALGQAHDVFLTIR